MSEKSHPPPNNTRMTKKEAKEQRLPSREIAYAFTAALHFAQRLEQGLRAILYTADYHQWGEPIELDECQMKRFKDADGFIDKATSGAIIEKLRASGLIKGAGAPRAFRAFENACAHRNKLAHSFLAEQNFDGMTTQGESKILHRLYQMTLDLYKAQLISEAIRKRAEYYADEHHKINRRIWRELMGDDSKYENPNRHYASRKRK